MTDSGGAQREALTDSELKAISYFAIGVGSEGVEAGVDISNRLSFAGNIRNGVMTPVGNSGLSIGTLQTDMGQHPDVAPALVDAYQVWATTNHPDWVLTDAQRTQTISDLSRNGRTINAQGGRTMDATVKSHLDTFLSSTDGIDYVHSNDLREVNKLMTRVMPRLRETALYQNATIEDKVKLATVVAKAYNQSEVWGSRILDRIQDDYTGANKCINLTEVNQAINDLPDGRSEYMRTGRDAALKGADVFLSLRNMDEANPLRQAWRDVLANPLINPNQTGQDASRPNLSSEYAATKNLFLRKENAPALVKALDQGGSYGYNIANHRGQSRPQSTSLYAAGDDFVVMDGNGIGKAYVGGTWSDVDRLKLTRVSNRDGTVDLNINRGGMTERLLHVDPSAPVLRPAQQPTEPAQPQHAPLPRQAAQERAPAATSHSDRLMEQYAKALAAGDDEGMRAASIAFLDTEYAQRLIAESQERVLKRQQQLPGRDQPLFVQAVQHLERLGPDVACYTDQADMERIAGAIAYQAKCHRMPGIDEIVPTRDGELMATWTNPRNNVLRHYATVDPIVASVQPLERNFLQLEAETQRQTNQDLQREQERQMSAQRGRPL